MKQSAKFFLAFASSVAILAIGSMRCVDSENPATVNPADYDSIPENVRIVAGAAENDTLLTDEVDFMWTNAGKTYEYSCRIDGGEWSAWATDTTFTDVLDDGDYTFEVRVRESEGGSL
jgi:hypothetical protein